MLTKQTHPASRRRSVRRGLTLAAAGLLPLATVVWLACRPETQPTHVPPGSRPAGVPIVLSGPTEAARSALLCLQAVHKARGAGGPGEKLAVARHMDQLELAAARDVILRYCQNSSPDPLKDPNQAVRNFIEGWAAIVNYYVDELNPDQLRPGHAAPEATEVEVYASASPARGSATVRFNCVRGEDAQWRVARVDFAPQPARTTQPSS